MGQTCWISTSMALTLLQKHLLIWYPSQYHQLQTLINVHLALMCWELGHVSATTAMDVLWHTASWELVVSDIHIHNTIETFYIFNMYISVLCCIILQILNWKFISFESLSLLNLSLIYSLSVFQILNLQFPIRLVKLTMWHTDRGILYPTVTDLRFGEFQIAPIPHYTQAFIANEHRACCVNMPSVVPWPSKASTCVYTCSYLYLSLLFINFHIRYVESLIRIADFSLVVP